MNREIDRPELRRLVAEKTGIDSQIVDIFIKQMFAEVESQMNDQSLVRLDNLGLFRIIKSGTTRRILFLGASKKEGPVLTTVTSRTKNNLPKINIIENRTSAVSAVSLPSSQLTNTSDKTVVSKQQPVASDKDDTPVNRNASAKEELLVETEKNTEKNTNDLAADTYRKPVYRHSRRDDMPRQEENFRKNIPLKYKAIMIAALILVVAVALFTFFMRPQNGYTSQTDIPADTNLKFAETENDDTKNISCAIIIDRDMSLRQLALMYYGDERFWPYLFKANENIITDGYTIPSQSIVKIPRVTVDLAELNTGQLDEKLNSLAEDIALKAFRK